MQCIICIPSTFSPHTPVLPSFDCGTITYCLNQFSTHFRSPCKSSRGENMEDIEMVANFSEGRPWQQFKDTIVQVN